MSELVPTDYRVMRELVMYHQHFTLMCLIRDCIKLGVFDALPTDVTRFTTIQELSTTLHLNEETLFRCLRFLSSYGYTCQSSLNIKFTNINYKDKMFSHSKKSLQLCRDKIGYHSFLFLSNKDVLSFSLDYTQILKTGISTFNNGNSLWNYFEKNKHYQDHFIKYMSWISRQGIQLLPKIYNFNKLAILNKEKFGHNQLIVADIGGSQGDVLLAITKGYNLYWDAHNDDTKDGFNITGNIPMKPILFDLPNVIENTFIQAHPGSNFAMVKGDFFQKIDCVADVYILKYILHDWLDDQCLIILKNIHKKACLRKNSRILIIEGTISNNESTLNKKDVVAFSDVWMMGITGGKERTVDEFDILLKKSGFYRTRKPIPFGMNWIIEAKTISVSRL